MNEESYSLAAQAMQLHGGSFFHSIGVAWMFADTTNRERLQTAFKPEFEKYATFFTTKAPQ